MADKEDWKRWYKEAKQQKATHVVIVCDTFEWEDFPVYVLPGQNAEKVRADHHGTNMQKVMDLFTIKQLKDLTEKM